MMPAEGVAETPPPAVRALRRRMPPGVGWFVLGVALTLVAGFLRPVVFHDSGLPPGKLVILSGQDDSPDHERQKLIDEWNADHPRNQAKIEELSPDATKQHSAMVAAAQSGRRDVDVYNLDVTWVAEFAAAGYVDPLSGTDTSGFLAKPLDTCRYQGRLWALPFNTDAALLYYRTGDGATRPDRVPPAGPDAYAMQLVGEGLTVNAFESVWSDKGDVLDGSNRPRIDSSAARQGIAALATAATRLSGTLKTPKSTLLNSFDERSGTNSFIAGKVSIMRNWPVAYAQISAAATHDGGVGDFRVSELPTPSVLGGQDLAVAKGSRNPQAARELVKFLTSGGSERDLFEKGGFAATREAVYHDSSVVTARPYAGTLLRAIKDARSRPKTPYYALFSAEFQDIVQATIRSTDENLPDDSVRRLDDALRGQPTS